MQSSELSTCADQVDFAFWLEGREDPKAKMRRAIPAERPAQVIGTSSSNWLPVIILDAE
jgi:hypothetical protein